MAGMVFRKSCQQRGTTGDGSEIDKRVIQADRDTSQVQKYLSLLSFDSPFMKRVLEVPIPNVVLIMLT